MPCYIDSSFLLSFLLEQNVLEKDISIWKDYTPRLSSFLLELECLITMRRIYSQNRKNFTKKWLTLKETELKDFIKEISIKNIDQSVLEIVELKRELSECRTLDAIHMATAILFSEHCSDPIFICSYDNRLRKLSKDFGFVVLPQSVAEI